MAVSVSIAFILLILGTEKEIEWNHLDGLESVNTTGQLIPLTVGCFSLFRAVMLIFFEKEEEPGAEPPAVLTEIVSTTPAKMIRHGATL
jgi:hypothetical protein